MILDKDWITWKFLATSYLAYFHIFIVIIRDQFLLILNLLNSKNWGSSDTVMVIHDYWDISNNVLPRIINYKLFTMRKTVQNFIKSKYDLNPNFIYHAFYPYPILFRNQDVKQFRLAVTLLKMIWILL